MTDSELAAHIIDFIGGPTAVARLCRCKPQAVSQWKRTGIPGPRRQLLELLAPAAFADAGVNVETQQPTTADA